MTSTARDADGENLQDKEPTSGALSGSPKLTFAQDAGGDTITRSEGTWDTGDGFAIGQRITISGALNGGNFTITDITDGGMTLVLDVRKTVNEIVTKALSIAGAVDAPVDDSPVDTADTPAISEAVSDAPAEGSPDDSADSGDLGWLFSDSSIEDSSIPDLSIPHSSIQHSPISSDDDPDADKPVANAPVSNSPTDGDDSGEESRRATHAPGRAIRSRSEVEKLLIALCDEKLTVTAYPEDGELLFAARVRAVDPDLSRIILEYSQWKPANSALLDCEQVLFHCERKNRHIQFLSGEPAEIVFDGGAGIQVGFPQFVLDLQQRTDRRFRLAIRASMWCVIKQEGSDPIVANVDDISRGGLGGIVHDPGVVLKPGTIVRDCQITGSELKRPIDVSVEIRYWKTIRSPEGLLSKRVGCRFVASSADLQRLIDVFIVDLDNDQHER
jgi:c-di-GMP-binding flagellar brake protein YcgR